MLDTCFQWQDLFTEEWKAVDRITTHGCAEYWMPALQAHATIFTALNEKFIVKHRQAMRCTRQATLFFTLLGSMRLPLSYQSSDNTWRLRFGEIKDWTTFIGWYMAKFEKESHPIASVFSHQDLFKTLREQDYTWLATTDSTVPTTAK